MLEVNFAENASLTTADRGFSYGDGLFETILMVGQKAVLRRHHINRMVADAGRLGIVVTYEEIDHALSRATLRYFADFEQCSEGRWILKMVLTRGSGGRGYRLPESAQPQLYLLASAPPPVPDLTGVATRQCSFPLTVNPRLAGIKTLNRLEQVMASREFTGNEWEMIMPDLAGHLVEGTRSNLMAHVGDEWLTPPLTSIAVAGVMRQYAMECLSAAGRRVSECLLSPDCGSLPDFRGLYLLNSVFGIVAVRSLDQVDLPVDGTLATICNPLETLE